MSMFHKALKDSIFALGFLRKSQCIQFKPLNLNLSYLI